MESPESLERDQRLASLLEGMFDARRQQGPVDLEAVALAHPDLAEEIRQLWGAIEVAALGAVSPKLPATVAPTETPAPPNSIPERIGEYELLEIIGQGGMGVVYKARQTSLDRIVALKVIRRGEQDRFRFEAEAAARLDHPNIVPVYGMGECEGQPYLSMKYIEGTTLARRADATPLPSAEAARLVLHVARAVQHAHEHGILHRDLKPSNVLLDRNGQPYVTDFGLAKQVKGGPSLTSTGVILGTPSYMPPEQVSGSRGQLGPASDVYSLGAILYELLTGRPPFRAASDVDTLLQVLDQEPVPPRQLNPGVERTVELICLKCLQKHADLRYQSAADLARDLERYLAGERPSVWSGNFTDVLNGVFRETHHASVLENWGKLWMWHSVAAFLQGAATAGLAEAHVESRWPYLLIWGVGLLIWCAIFWQLRKRGGPVLFVERVIAHVWGSGVIATIGIFLIEISLDLRVLTLSPILPVLGGMIFLIKGGLLSGYFYIPSGILFLTSLPMAWLMGYWRPGAPLVFGVVIALSFFLPGLKYYRQQRVSHRRSSENSVPQPPCIHTSRPS